jgi:hypothetical protein
VIDVFKKTFLCLAGLLTLSCAPDYGVTTEERIIYQEFVQDTAVEGDIWVDSFFQSQATNGIDIIWVIDQSGSMNSDYDRIIAGIEAMLNALPNSDWRLNIISTDPDSGTLQATFPIVPGDDLKALLSLYADMAIAAGEEERGFSALYNYITYNSSADWWLRRDAALLVVFVSDEEDQSYSQFPDAISDFISWYTQMRSNGSTFMSSIVNIAKNSACDVQPTGNNVGSRYIEATNYLNGAVIDFCSDDWSQGVSDAVDGLDPVEELELTHIPYVDSIRVFYDGIDITSGWHYDVLSNKVIFDVVPDGGVLVEIGYIVDTLNSDYQSS